MAGESILIVDDTPVNLKLTRILLVNEGYKVLTAASAEEAVELLRSYHPTLILADVQLPGMDGLELTRRVKQGASTRDILVVALTAFAGKGDEQKAIDAGCDGYITKPIDTRALGSRIRGILDRRNESPPPAAPPAAGTAQAEHTGSRSGRNAGFAAPFPGRGSGKVAAVAAGAGRAVQCQRCGQGGAPVDRHGRASGIYGHQPPGARSGSRAARASGGQLPASRLSHQPGPVLQQPARGPRRAYFRADREDAFQ